MPLRELIRNRARELGFDDCRFTTSAPPESAARFLDWLRDRLHGCMAYLERNAHKRVEPQKVLPGAQTIISLAAAYAGAPPRFQGDQPTGIVARYARHLDYHDVLADRLRSLAEFVSGLGGPDARSLWYTDTGPLLERDLGQRAGIGFIGKHTNLVSRTLGNWFLLGEIITTVRLEPDHAERNRCGRCTRCMVACPTTAITEPFVLDSRRCISYLTIESKGPIPEELRPMIGNRIFGCDDCLAACPWNRFAREGSLMKQHARADLEAPELAELLGLEETEFNARFSGTPIARAKRRGFLRNVCVALGNTGDHRALPALERASREPDPLVAEHASWAIRRIQARQATLP